MPKVTATMESNNTKGLRARARWSILRRALLVGTSASTSFSSSSHDNDDGAAGNPHSMNTFPGFRVLHRTILPSSLNTQQLPILTADAIAATASDSGEITDSSSLVADDAGGEDDSRWDIVQYKYLSNTNCTSASSSTEEIQFITRETRELRSKPATIQDRLEGLLSHRNHNGVDNTGNVRVWDAEMTLAGFLLDVVASLARSTSTGDATRHQGDNAGLSLLRDQIRSLIETTCTPEIKDCAGTRTATTTSRTNPSTVESQETVCNILELGAGQAGLAGLAMMAASYNSYFASHGTGLSKMKPCRVILTDGHPKCVENNKICVHLTRKMIVSKVNESVISKTSAITTTQSSTAASGVAVEVECNLLLWDASPNGARACRQINNLVQPDIRPLSTLVNNSRDGTAIFEPAVVSSDDEGMYHLCLASDCVHFQEFHHDLLITIARTLAVDGMALMCQPKRGSSLNNFIELIDTVNNDSARTIRNEASTLGNKHPLFEVTLYEEFHPKVSEIHKALVAESKNVVDPRLPSSSNSTEKKFIQRWSEYYDTNWHLPLLLVLKKLRLYDEDIDGEAVRQHVKKRVAV